jgi:hypothetical protein
MKRIRKVFSFIRRWPTVSQAVLYRRIWQSWAGMPGGLAIGLTFSHFTTNVIPTTFCVLAWLPIVVMALLRFEPRMRRQLRAVDDACRALLDIGSQVTEPESTEPTS